MLFRSFILDNGFTDVVSWGYAPGILPDTMTPGLLRYATEVAPRVRELVAAARPKENAKVSGFLPMERAWIDALLSRGAGQDRLLILGATEAGERIRSELESAPELGWKAVGFVDENPALRGQNFSGLPVLGKYADLPELVRTYRPAGIIISHESSSHNEILRVVSYVAEFPITIFIVPDLYDAASGHFKTNAVHGIALKELVSLEQDEQPLALMALDAAHSTLVVVTADLAKGVRTARATAKAAI